MFSHDYEFFSSGNYPDAIAYRVHLKSRAGMAGAGRYRGCFGRRAGVAVSRYRPRFNVVFLFCAQSVNTEHRAVSL